MSVETESGAQAVEVRYVAPSPGARAHTYTLSWSGVWAVAQLDRKRLIRGPRSLTMLAFYGGIFTVLAVLARVGASPLSDANGERGAMMFGVLVYLVLGVCFAITPLLSATAINADAHNNVLSTLQRTQLSPAEIAVGKLLSAWISGLVLIVVALPGLIWAYVEGGTSIVRMLITLGVVAATMLAGCAVGLGWSAMVDKAGSAMTLTALTLGAGVIGLPLLYALLLPVTVQTDRVLVSSTPVLGSPDVNCVTETLDVRQPHGERIWWLLAVSPLAIVADTSPVRGVENDPLTYVREMLRNIRLAPPDSINNCAGVSEAELERRAQLRDGLSPTWPLGVFVDGVVTLIFLQIAIEKLRTSNTRPPVRGSVV